MNKGLCLTLALLLATLPLSSAFPKATEIIQPTRMVLTCEEMQNIVGGIVSPKIEVSSPVARINPKTGDLGC